jgi:proline racemase
VTETVTTICTSVDFHTAGEPFRIVAEPPVEIPGASVAERRELAVPGSAADDLRRLLCFEPRGHADMYGGFVTEPDDDGADFGVLFWHKDGFSTACGHGTMALGAWAVSAGIVAVDPSGTTEVTIDVPSGRVRAQVHTDAEGRATSVDFVNVPSRLVASGLTVDTSLGPVTVDLAWGGAIYALVDVAQLGAAAGSSQAAEVGRLGEVSCEVVPENLTALIALGREVKAGLADHPDTVHPEDDRLSMPRVSSALDRRSSMSRSSARHSERRSTRRPPTASFRSSPAVPTGWPPRRSRSTRSMISCPGSCCGESPFLVDQCSRMIFPVVARDSSAVKAAATSVMGNRSPISILRSPLRIQPKISSV